MSIHTIAYIQNPCIHTIANMVPKVINFIQTSNVTQPHHTSLAYHTQPRQQLKYLTSYALQKHTCIHQKK